MPAEIYLGQCVTATINASASGISGTVVITDQVPAGWTVLDPAGGTTFTVGMHTYITWTMTGTAAITLHPVFCSPSPDPQAGGCDQCGTRVTNVITATGRDCRDCVKTATARASTYIQCDTPGVGSNKAVSAPVPACTDPAYTYTNTYSFNGPFVVTPTWGSIVFTDVLAFQSYVPGSAVVRVSDGTTSCTATFSLLSTAPLVIANISPVCAIAVPGATMWISYRTSITEPSPCADFQFYDWSYINLGVTGNSECADDGILEEGVFVTQQAPAMEVTLSELPDAVSSCGGYTFTLSLRRTSEAPAYDVYLEVPTTTYYILEVLGFGGVTPVSTQTNALGYRWAYSDSFTTATTATVRMRVQMRCSTVAPFEATVYYGNACREAQCATGGTLASPPVYACHPFVTKFPEVIFANADVVTWTLIVFNSGAGPAYDVTLNDVLGSDLRYFASDITSTMGSASAASVVTSSHRVTWTLPVIQPKERVTIPFVAEVIGCDDLTNRFSLDQGCLGESCLQPPPAVSHVELPPTILINTNFLRPINTCTDGMITATVRNGGLLSVYTATINEELPAGLEYIPGTTEYVVGTGTTPPPGGWIPGGDPSGTGAPGDPLTWTYREIPNLARLYPQETVWVRFMVHVGCSFAGGPVSIRTSYIDLCGDYHLGQTSSYLMGVNQPTLEVAKIETSPGPYDCGDEVDWAIYVTNTSGVVAPVVRITDTLGTGLSLVNASPGYTQNGQVLTWTLGGVLGTQMLTVTARIITPCTSVLDQVQAAWGCGTVGAIECLDEAHVATASDDIVRATPSVVALITSEPMTSCTDAGVVTVTVTNNGTGVARNINLSITRPVGGPFLYTIPALAPGEFAVFTFTVDLDCATAATLVLTGSYQDCCSNSYSLNASHALNISRPLLNITISPTPTDLTCGDLVMWTVTVRNTSATANAEAVRVGAQLTAAFDFVSATPPHCYDGNGPAPNEYVYWEIADLAPGASRVFTITATYRNPGGIPNGCNEANRRISVRAYWGCGTPDGDPSTGLTFSGGPCNGPDVGIECMNTAYASRNSTPALIPDLTIAAVDPVFSACSPSPVGAITVTVHNQDHGTDDGPVPVSTTLRVTVTVDPGLPEEQTYVLIRHVDSPMAVSNTLILTGTFLPDEFSCGLHSYRATLAPVCECDWSNNTRSGNFFIDCSGVSTIVTRGACDLNMTAIGHITGSTPYTWTWYYANGTWSTGVTNSPLITTSHTYTWCGDYAVSLVVSDSVGCILTDRYRRRNTFLRYERAL